MNNDRRIKMLQVSIKESLLIQEGFFAENLALLARAFDRIVEALRRGGKLMIMGNGGSAADAQHLAAEFVNRYRKDRSPLPAIALTTDSSIMTAIGNDSDYRYLFSRQIEALGRPEDIVLAISTSGNSPNVVEGIKLAQKMGIYALALAGGEGGLVKEIADLTICVAGTNQTPRIQETFLVLEHLLCEWIESELFPGLNPA